jgi:hypothetical protein
MRIFILAVMLISTTGQAKEWHITTDGSSTGSGTIEDPITIKKALELGTPVQAGDTILIHGGRYFGTIWSKVAGTQGNPVIVKPYNKENVIFDAGPQADWKENAILQSYGSDVWFIDLLFTSSESNRVSTIAGPHQSEIYTATGLNLFGERNKVINCRFHDCIGGGIGLWSTAANSEVYGCIIFHNGWVGPDKGHSHGIYTQNENGVILIHDNIFFNAMSQNFQAYSTNGGGAAGYELNNNMSFNSGIIDATQQEWVRNYLLASPEPIVNVIMENNYAYHNNPQGQYTYPSVQIGYNASIANESVIVKNNYFIGGSTAAHVNWYSKIEFTDNTFHSWYHMFDLADMYDDSSLTAEIQIWDNNSYYGANGQTTFAGQFFDDYRASRSFDTNGSYFNKAPTVTRVEVLPNKYRAGRGHIYIFNWENLDSAKVDISSVSAHNDVVNIYDIENLYGGPVVSIVYLGAAIEIPLNLTDTYPPHGIGPLTPAHTDKEFGVYLILSNEEMKPSPLEVN